MAIRGIVRSATKVGIASRTNVPIYVDSDDNKLKMIPAGSGSTEVEVVDASSAQTLTNKTITGPQGPEPVETVITTNVLTAAESGKTFFLALATGFVTTLPAPAAGLKFRFIVAIAPSGGTYTIVTDGAPAQILAGQVHSSTGGDADSEAAATATTITFADGVAVIGDWAEVISDGTSWFGQVFVNADAGATFTG